MIKKIIIFISLFFVTSCNPKLYQNRMLFVAWDSYGRPCYANCNKQQNPQHIRWNHMPLTYYVLGENNIADDAVQRWNNELNFVAFVKGDINSDIFIVIYENQDKEKIECDLTLDYFISASTTHIKLNNNLKAFMQIEPSPINSLQYAVITHELGHALGLQENDNDENSVMNRYFFLDDFLEPTKFSNPEITSIDKVLLRNIYLQ